MSPLCVSLHMDSSKLFTIHVSKMNENVETCMCVHAGSYFWHTLHRLYSWGHCNHLFIALWLGVPVGLSASAPFNTQVRFWCEPKRQPCTFLSLILIYPFIRPLSVLTRSKSLSLKPSQGQSYMSATSFLTRLINTQKHPFGFSCNYAMQYCDMSWS